METEKIKRLRKKDLNAVQILLVFGSMLGDGHFLKTTHGFASRVNHSVAQRNYVHWKYQIMKDFVLTKPKISADGKCCYFRTISHPFFEELAKIFLDENGKKILPSTNFLSKYLIPHKEGKSSLAIAVWVGDDGAADGNQTRINTQNFSYEENQRLQKFLYEKLGIMSTLNKDKKYWRLRIADEAMPKFTELIGKYLPRELRYKIPSVIQVNIKNGRDPRARILDDSSPHNIFLITKEFPTGKTFTSVRSILEGLKFPPGHPNRYKCFDAPADKAKEIARRAKKYKFAGKRCIWDPNKKRVEFHSKKYFALVEMLIRKKYQQHPEAMKVLKNIKKHGISVIADCGHRENRCNTVPSEQIKRITNKILSGL